MSVPDIVIDTNVVVSALRSRRGASHRLLTLVGRGRFEIHLSVPLVLEYEYAARELPSDLSLDEGDVADILDYLCAVGRLWDVFFLWRPLLRDPGDDMILELAVTAGCDAIVSYNKRDLSRARDFGLRVLDPREFLIELGDLP